MGRERLLPLIGAGLFNCLFQVEVFSYELTDNDYKKKI